MSSASDRDTRTCLLQAASTLFAKIGFAATSVKNIAEKAGVNISLVSYHFGGKEGLLRACVDPFVKSQIEFLDSKIANPKNIEDFRFKLRLFIESLIEVHLKNEKSANICISMADYDDPLYQELLKSTMKPLSDRTQSFIESAQKAKFIRSDIDSQSIVLLLVGGLLHALRVDQIRKKLFHKTLHDQKTREQLINASVEMFLNGLERKN